jgi:hypothetical protein
MYRPSSAVHAASLCVAFEAHARSLPARLRDSVRSDGVRHRDGLVSMEHLVIVEPSASLASREKIADWVTRSWQVFTNTAPGTSTSARPRARGLAEHPVRRQLPSPVRDQGAVRAAEPFSFRAVHPAPRNPGQPMTQTLTFSLRGRKGSVAVRCEANRDPDRLGYRLLGLPWPSQLAAVAGGDPSARTTVPGLDLRQGVVRVARELGGCSTCDDDDRTSRRTG